jgi:Cu-processing system permease protein
VSWRARSTSVLAVAALAFRESARNRVLHALVGVMFLVCGLSFVFAWVAGGDVDPVRQVKIVGDLGLSGLVVMGTVASIFLGTNLIYQEIEKRTIYSVLARPLSRSGFLIGKYLGLAAIMGVATAIMGVVFLAAFRLAGGPITLALLISIFFVYVELLVVIAVALFFSVTAHPLEGAVFSFVIAVAGHQTASLNDLAREIAINNPHAMSAVAGQKLLWVAYVLLPNLENFNLRGAAVYGIPLNAGQVGWALLYAVIYVVVTLAAASIMFRRRLL